MLAWKLLCCPTSSFVDSCMYTLELWIEMASLVNITVTIITGEDVPEDTGEKKE